MFQYTIPEVDNKYRFDFYLPEYRILIEFHGKQHYEPIAYFGGEDTFRQIRRNDSIKKSMANDTKYLLLVFNYTHISPHKGPDHNFRERFLKVIEKSKPVGLKIKENADKLFGKTK